MVTPVRVAAAYPHETTPTWSSHSSTELCETYAADQRNLDMKSSFPKGPKSTFWVISGIQQSIQNYTFGITFMSLAYSVLKLWLSAFQIFKQFQLFISKNNVNLFLFSWKIIDGNVYSKTKPKEPTFDSIFIPKSANFWNLWFFPKLVKLDIFNKKQKQP